MRFPWLMGAALIIFPVLAWAQLGQRQPGDPPSVTDATLPMSYVGGDTRVSVGIDSDGNTQGEVMGVFGDNGARAVVGQLWWGNGGAGGVQFDYNWLWSLAAEDAKARPADITVARMTIALDQNAQHDRKATFGAGLARPNYYLDAYLSAAASGSGNGGANSNAIENTINGQDALGSYTQTQVTTLTTLFDERPYRAGVGMSGGHFSDALTLRGFGGLEYQTGAQGAHQTTVSFGIDKYLGVHGWSMTGLAEHSQSSGPVDGSVGDNRISVLLRYEFGGNGAFVPSSDSATPAWVARSLREPTSSHTRTVSTYRTVRSVDTSTTLRPDKHYTNRAPVAVDDSANVAANSRDNPIDVLANDTDPDGDVLTITQVGAPLHGSAALAGRVINYTPTAGYSGSDHFTYTISDGHGHSASASVTVSIAPVPNRAPIARNDVATTPYGKPVTIAVLANDSDPDGDPITLAAVGSPAHGSATRNQDSSVTYAPIPTFSGTDQFTYTIADDHGHTASATVVINVSPAPNRAPIARDDAATTAYGQPVRIAVLANDSDPDGDTLQLGSVSSPAHGIAARNPDGSITYTPSQGFSGIDQFTYTIGDGHGHSASATVTVTVLARPNQPPVAVNDAVTIPFDPQALAYPAATIDVLQNDSDPDGDALSVVSVTQPSSGTAVINPDNSVTYTAGQRALPGTYVFSYTISDGHSHTATATVTVTLANPIP